MSNEKSLFPKIEPWNEPVNGVELADQIQQTLERFLFLPTGASAALTIWILHTYAPDCFDFTPRVCIMSPEKRCGKSTLLSLIEYLSFRVINVSNITAAAMFRSIEKWRPTLLIDEVDTFLKNADDLRGVINSGFQKDGKVIRVEPIGKILEPVVFNCFAPCAIAGIGRIPDTILDRGFGIIMKRKTEKENKDAFRTRDIAAIAADIQRKCLRFMSDNAADIRSARPILPSYLNDRACDVWEPLFAIAGIVSSEWAKKIEESAFYLVNGIKSLNEESCQVQLLRDIKQIFDSTDTEYQDSTKLVELLNGIDCSPWGAWNNGRGINVQYLAAKLKYFAITPMQTRKNDVRTRKYERKQFQDAFNRYL